MYVLVKLTNRVSAGADRVQELIALTPGMVLIKA